MAEDEEHIEWDLSLNVDGQPIKLRTAAEVRKFLNDQNEFYQFIRDDEALIKQGVISNVRSWANFLTRLDGMVTQAKTDPNVLNQVKGHLANHGKSSLPFHNSVEAQLIRRIWQDHGAVEGAAAAVVIADTANQEIWNGRETSVGAILALLASVGFDFESTKDVEGHLIDIRGHHEKSLAELSARSTQVSDEFDKFLKGAESKHTQLNNFLTEGIQKLGEDHERRTSEAIESIENTEKVYTEHMHLRAPREYWATKAKGHEDRRWWFAAVAMGWFVLGGLAVAALGWKLFDTALALSLKPEGDLRAPVTVLASLGGAALLGTTVYLWIARIVVRLFLSEIHLGMDARERVVMVDSYLALLNKDEGAVDNEHRTIILSALFRPTQDGIVKDDAAADPTLLGFIRQASRS